MATFNPVSLERERNQRGAIRLFTISEANRSLVLVRKIVRDVLNLYCRAKMIEEQYSILDRETERDERGELKQSYESILKELKLFTSELNSIGCQLRDWQTGTVDWPAMLDGREVYFCWRMGESDIRYWHEAYESFAARKRIYKEFE